MVVIIKKRLCYKLSSYYSLIINPINNDLQIIYLQFPLPTQHLSLAYTFVSKTFYSGHPLQYPPPLPVQLALASSSSHFTSPSSFSQIISVLKRPSHPSLEAIYDLRKFCLLVTLTTCTLFSD